MSSEQLPIESLDKNLQPMRLAPLQIAISSGDGPWYDMFWLTLRSTTHSWHRLAANMNSTMMSWYVWRIMPSSSVDDSTIT